MNKHLLFFALSPLCETSQLCMVFSLTIAGINKSMYGVTLKKWILYLTDFQNTKSCSVLPGVPQGTACPRQDPDVLVIQK